jgi:hypothetical protein
MQSKRSWNKQEVKINKLERMHYCHYKRLCSIIGKFDEYVKEQNIQNIYIFN